VTSRRNFSSVRRGAERFRTTGWLAACGGAASRARAKAQLRIGAAAGGTNYKFNIAADTSIKQTDKKLFQIHISHLKAIQALAAYDCNLLLDISLDNHIKGFRVKG
jgi:hypothetical protein